MTVPGFGVPINNPTPIHWWQEDGQAICDDDDSLLRFLGSKLKLREVNIVDVCPKCYNLIQPIMSAVWAERSDK